HNECTDDVCMSGACGSNPHSGTCNGGHGVCKSATCECGKTGDPCCLAPAEPCADHSACNAMTGTCGNCGTVGQPCCGSDCTSGLCMAGMCVACGGNNQPCCASSQCNSGTVCTAMTCKTCGGSNQPCCAGSACTDDANACNGSE